MCTSLSVPPASPISVGHGVLVLAPAGTCTSTLQLCSLMLMTSATYTHRALYDKQLNKQVSLWKSAEKAICYFQRNEPWYSFLQGLW